MVWSKGVYTLSSKAKKNLSASLKQARHATSTSSNTTTTATSVEHQPLPYEYDRPMIDRFRTAIDTVDSLASSSIRRLEHLLSTASPQDIQLLSKSSKVLATKADYFQQTPVSVIPSTNIRTGAHFFRPLFNSNAPPSCLYQEQSRAASLADGNTVSSLLPPSRTLLKHSDPLLVDPLLLVKDPKHAIHSLLASIDPLVSIPHSSGKRDDIPGEEERVRLALERAQREKWESRLHEKDAVYQKAVIADYAEQVRRKNKRKVIRALNHAVEMETSPIVVPEPLVVVHVEPAPKIRRKEPTPVFDKPKASKASIATSDKVENGQTEEAIDGEQQQQGRHARKGSKVTSRISVSAQVAEAHKKRQQELEAIQALEKEKIALQAREENLLKKKAKLKPALPTGLSSADSSVTLSKKEKVARLVTVLEKLALKRGWKVWLYNDKEIKRDIAQV